MCGALWGVQGSSRVGARVRAAGDEATCRATYIPSPHVSMGDSSPKMPMVTSSSPLDAQAELPALLAAIDSDRRFNAQ